MPLLRIVAIASALTAERDVFPTQSTHIVTKRWHFDGSEGSIRRGTRSRLPSAAMQIGEFQALMVQLYGEQDRERGIPATVAWLAEEVGELAQAVRKGSLDQQRHELGDVLAWLASLANQLGLSLEEAAERYVTDPPV